MSQPYCEEAQPATLPIPHFVGAENGAAQSEFSRGATLAAVTVAIFTDMLLYDMVVPFLPASLVRLGADSDFAVGLLFGAYAVSLLAATPLCGIAADRYGRRGPILAGIFGLVAATLLYSVSTSYWGMVVARMLQGAAGAAVWTAGLALVADIYPTEKRGWALGIAMSGTSLGTLLGPPVGGVLHDWGGYRLPFLMAAGFALVTGVVMLAVLPRMTRLQSRPAFDRQILRQPALLVTAAIVIFGATVLSLLEPLLPLHLERQLQGTPTSIGLIFAAAVVAYGACAPLAGWLADRVGRPPVMLGAMLASVFTVPLIAVPQTWWGEGVALALLGTTCAFLLTPALPELADQLDRAGSQAYGVAYAIFNTAYAIGMMAGPLAGGAAAEAWGFLAALEILAVLALAGIPALWWIGRRGAR